MLLVTGGAKGITFECALGLARECASLKHVVLVGRSETDSGACERMQQAGVGSCAYMYAYAPHTREKIRTNTLLPRMLMPTYKPTKE